MPRLCAAALAAPRLQQKKGATLPTEWTIEWRRGKYGKFKKIEAEVVTAPPSAKAPRPKKDEKPKQLAPLGIELLFKPGKGRQFRLVPKTPARIARIVVSRLGK